MKTLADGLASFLSTILAHPFFSGATVLAMALGNPKDGVPISPGPLVLGVLFISVFPVTLLAFSFGPVILPLYLLAVALSWARVHTRAHSVTQAATGALVSTGVTSIVCVMMC